jgi:hypothetical protein
MSDIFKAIITADTTQALASIKTLEGQAQRFAAASKDAGLSADQSRMMFGKWGEQTGRSSGQVLSAFDDASVAMARGSTAAGKFSAAASGTIDKLGGITTVAPLAGAAAAKMAYDLASAAASYGETVNKAGVIFGRSRDEIVKFAEGASESLGQSKQQALDAATTFGLFGKSAGLAGSDLTAFSTDLVRLATDLASINDTSVPEAIEAIGAGLRGEAEPLRRFGILLDDATLRQKALEMGIISNTKNALTPQQKVLASQAEILRQGAYAAGDYQATSDSLGNSQKTLGSQIENLSLEIGETLLPLFEDLVQNASALMDALGKVPGGYQRIAESIKMAIAPGAVFVDNLRNLISGSDDAADATEKFGGSIRATLKDREDSIAMTRAGIIADREASEATEALRKEMEGQQKAIDAAREALERRNEALLDAAGFGDDLERTEIRLTQAIDAYNESVGESGYESAATKEQLFGLRDAILAQVRAAEAAYIAQAAANGETVNAEQRALAQARALDQLASRFPGLAGEIQRYRDSLALIPKEITTNLRVTGSGDVSVNLGGGRTLMAEGGVVMPRRGGVDVTVAEAGVPEAIIPLDRAGSVPSLGGGNTLTIEAGAITINGAASGEDIVSALTKWMRQNGRNPGSFGLG